MTDSSKFAALEKLESIIGRVTILWNDMHFMVFAMFANMLHNRGVAQALYFALHTDRAQRDITRALAKDALFLWSPLQAHALDLLTRIDKMAGRRNDLVHAMWELSHPDMAPELFGPSSPRLGAKDIKKELDALILDITLLRVELGDVLLEIEQTLRAHDVQRGRLPPASPFVRPAGKTRPPVSRSRSAKSSPSKKK